MQIITDNNERLAGTVFRDNTIIQDDNLVLETLVSGGELRGWRGLFWTTESVGDFELLTSKELKRDPDYGDGRRVSGRVVERLVDQGFIYIPPKKGRQRLAIARLSAATSLITIVQ